MFWGIDPSISNTGLVGLDENGELVVAMDCGKNLTEKFKVARYVQQAALIAEVIKGYQGPHFLAYEDYIYDEKCKHKLASLAEQGGAIKAALLGIGVTETIYASPTEVKLFGYGDGHATKPMVAEAMIIEFPELKGRVSRRQGYDLTDAASLALMCLYNHDPDLAIALSKDASRTRDRAGLALKKAVIPL